MDIEKTLSERGKRYGEFKGHAAITQRLKDVMQAAGGPGGLSYWHNLNASQREALEMIAHKIGRILNGDPNYADSWHDIAGYASLVEMELTEDCKGISVLESLTTSERIAFVAGQRSMHARSGEAVVPMYDYDTYRGNSKLISEAMEAIRAKYEAERDMLMNILANKKE